MQHPASPSPKVDEVNWTHPLWTHDFLFMKLKVIFPQQQNAMGSLHNIDFGVFWASWGSSGKEPFTLPGGLLVVVVVVAARESISIKHHTTIDCQRRDTCAEVSNRLSTGRKNGEIGR